MAPRLPLHAVSWVVYLVVLVWIIVEMRRQQWHSLLYVALWVLHSVVFYSTLLAIHIFWPAEQPDLHEYFTWWANVLAMHGGFAILSILWGVRKYING